MLMNIVIYNINSFGGNYEYSKYLFQAYRQNGDINKCTLLMPRNSVCDFDGVNKLLLYDLPHTNIKIIKKAYYLYRSAINPFRLFFYLKKQPSSFIIFNDFDQITAWLWAPFFRLLKSKHTFSVILHDPDRDKFFRIKILSQSSMKVIISFMDIVFYHGFLPVKPYYDDSVKKINVPHGIYNQSEIDKLLLQDIIAEANGDKIIGVLGNIRDEKNYLVIIDSLLLLENIKLLIAGKPANSGVSTDSYKRYATEKGVASKIIWRESYLTDAGFNAAIAACDIVLLYYKPTFTSQSGVLNTIATFKKKLIISDIESSLKKSADQFGLGAIVPYDDPPALAKAVKKLLLLQVDHFSSAWNNYIHSSSWEKHVLIATNVFKDIK